MIKTKPNTLHYGSQLNTWEPMFKLNIQYNVIQYAFYSPSH